MYQKVNKADIQDTSVNVKHDSSLLWFNVCLLIKFLGMVIKICIDTVLIFNHGVGIVLFL